MIDLAFQVDGVSVPPHAAAPALSFALRISETQADTPIHNILLRCQLRIDPTKRRYGPNEQQQLVDLFGEPSRWGQTLRSMVWTHATAVIPQFIGSTTIELPIPCTFDFNVAATKYFNGLENGEVPLTFLFSGTIFHGQDDGSLQITQIPWEKEAAFRLPIATWKQMMEVYYPNCAWLTLRKDVFDRLSAYKSSKFLPTWEQAVERLLDSAEEPVT